MCTCMYFVLVCALIADSSKREKEIELNAGTSLVKTLEAMKKAVLHTKY